MSPRASHDLIADLIDLCRETATYIEGVSLPQFRRNRALQRAVERTLELIGEVVTQLGDRAPDIGMPWAPIKAMRIILAHAYHKVDATVVYTSAVQHIPILLRALENLPKRGRARANHGDNVSR